MMYIIVIMSLLFFPFQIFAESALDIVKSTFELSGYIKYEAFFDTRHVVGEDDNQVLYFPEKKREDVNGEDLNNGPQGDMAAFETRMHLLMKAPVVNNVTTQGVIEVDFFGRFNVADICDLRFAYVDVIYKNLTITGGQLWTPLYIDNHYPNTIANNNGNPFDPYAFNPQIRFVYDYKGFSLLGAALVQLTSPSDGPYGYNTIYMRNAVLPNLHFQLKYEDAKRAFGCAYDVKRLVPREVSNKGLRVHESIMSSIWMVFASSTIKDVVLNSKFLIGQAMDPLSVLGGYAVHSIDPVTDKRTYTNLSSLAWWLDVEALWPKLRPGLFVGYSKNNGSNKTIVPDSIGPDGIILERRVYGFGVDIHDVFRIAPRFRWIFHHITCGFELEYTRASYGKLNEYAQVIDTVPVGNLRFLGALYYNF